MTKNNKKTNEDATPKKSLNFIEAIVEKDLENNKNDGRVHTRFPPEPNGYLHIGHAKSICLNFGLAEKYNGKCNLRFDDTNPEKEDVEYVDAIKNDVQWLGFQWYEKTRFASDYFKQLYDWAVELIKKGKAYVCELTADEIAEFRGTPTIPATPSPYRDRPVDENLQLFDLMRQGKFEEGALSLRAKIDLASSNMHMRDPIMYRVKRFKHHRTGTEWSVYPMYDWAHGLSDYIEGITHSVCTLEFEVHRPLYDWFIDQLVEKDQYRPQQIEFARLNLTYTIMSKRLLQQLVKQEYVSGWDDPRMPTIAGLRRRGYTPASIRNFAEKVGVAKRENIIDVALLEHSVRDDLNKSAARRMAVLDPLKVVIVNYPEDQIEELEAINNPEDEAMGKRKIPFSKTIYIEQNDFMEDAPKKFFRLAPGREVRLRYAYFIKCVDVIKDEKTGKIIEIQCTYDPKSRGGKSPDGRKVKGTLHWVCADTCLQAEVRLYDRLFNREDPYDTPEGEDFTSNINPESLQLVTAFVEPGLSDTKVEDHFQFERIGYFCTDRDSRPNNLVFNRTVTLRDTWAKIAKMNKK